MLKLVISGCNGVMGRTLDEVISSMEDATIVAGIDRNPDAYNNTYPVYSDACDIKEECDALIDFSHPSNLKSILDFAVKNRVSIVMATTGLNEEQEKMIEDASKDIAIFKSSNTSLGVNVLINLVKQAAKVLSETFDIEIIEKHHNKKIDAPSGTAYMIANAINEELDNSKEFNYGRVGTNAKREKNEIGIHAVRGGTIPGEHTVIFAGVDEIIEVKHTAMSKKIFAQGAVKAARFVAQKENGYYCMDSLMKNN